MVTGEKVFAALGSLQSRVVQAVRSLEQVTRAVSIRVDGPGIICDEDAT